MLRIQLHHESSTSKPIHIYVTERGKPDVHIGVLSSGGIHQYVLAEGQHIKTRSSGPSKRIRPILPVSI